MRNIFGFFGSFIWAFASTANAMVSNVIGQGKKNEVMRLTTKIMFLSCAAGLTVCLFLNLFPRAFLSIYGQGREFMDVGIPVLRVVALAMLFMSVGTIWLNAVTGTGNGKITFMIELAAISLYCIYVYVVLELQKLSIVWGWMSEFLYWSTLFSLSFIYMKSKRWQSTVM